MPDAAEQRPGALSGAGRCSDGGIHLLAKREKEDNTILEYVHKRETNKERSFNKTVILVGCT